MLNSGDSGVHSGVQVGEGESRRELVRRIAESESFRRSQRLREMLLYISECTLAGRHEDLSESRIAEHVFGRDQYEPAVDSLVRVAARQLRGKLHDYFASEGREEEFLLDVPKGGYTVAFKRLAPAAAPSLPPVIPSVVAAAPGRRHAILPAAAALVLLLSAAIFLLERRAAPILPVPQTLVGAFLIPSHRTRIVVADSAVVLLSRLAHRSISVEEYADRSYLDIVNRLVPKGVPADFLDILESRQITSLADFHITAHLLQLYASRCPNLVVQHAHDVRARDFDSDDDFILIGSRLSNPWAELYERSLRFRIDNRCFVAPAGHPPRQYCAAVDASENGVDYARVAVLRNGDHRGRVLLIEGMNMEATEAAGEFGLNPRQFAGVLQALGVKRAQDLDTYELILQTYDVGGTGRMLRIADHARP